MRTGSIHRGGKRLIATVWHADRWWSRLRGLLFRAPLRADGGNGMLITPCASIHTCGMRYRIDVVFLDRDGVVLGCHESVPPLRFRMQRHARSALELAAGAARIHAIAPGDRLSWHPHRVEGSA